MVEGRRLKSSEDNCADGDRDDRYGGVYKGCSLAGRGFRIRAFRYIVAAQQFGGPAGIKRR